MVYTTARASRIRGVDRIWYQAVGNPAASQAPTEGRRMSTVSRQGLATGSRDIQKAAATPSTQAPYLIWSGPIYRDRKARDRIGWSSICRRAACPDATPLTSKSGKWIPRMPDRASWKMGRSSINNRRAMGVSATPPHRSTCASLVRNATQKTGTEQTRPQRGTRCQATVIDSCWGQWRRRRVIGQLVRRLKNRPASREEDRPARGIV